MVIVNNPFLIPRRHVDEHSLQKYRPSFKMNKFFLSLTDLMIQTADLNENYGHGNQFMVKSISHFGNFTVIFFFANTSVNQLPAPTLSIDPSFAGT